MYNAFNCNLPQTTTSPHRTHILLISMFTDHLYIPPASLNLLF